MRKQKFEEKLVIPDVELQYLVEFYSSGKSPKVFKNYKK